MNDMLQSKKASMGTRVLVGILVTIILVIILVQFVSGTASQVTSAGNSLNTTLNGQGLAPLFAGNNSILMLVVVLALTFGYRDTFRGKKREPLLSMAAESVRLIWHSARLRALLMALFLLFAGWMLAFTYAPLAITTLYHGDEPGTAVGMVLGAGGLTALVLSPMVGALADRFGHWRALFAGAGVAVLLWPLPWFASDLVSLGIAWALINGLVSAVFAISFTVLSSSAPSEVRGRVMSFAYLPVNVGFMMGPGMGRNIANLIVRGTPLMPLEVFDALSFYRDFYGSSKEALK